MSAFNSGNLLQHTLDPRKIEFPYIDQQVMGMRAIVVGMVLGLLLFTSLAWINLKDFNWQSDLLAWFGWASILTMIPLSIILPAKIVSAQLRTSLVSEETLPPGPPLFEKFARFFLIRLIVGVGLLEGAGFFNAIAFYLGQNPLSLVAVAVSIALILAKFPSKWQLQTWIAEGLPA